MKAVFHGREVGLVLSAKLYRYLSTDLGAEGMEGGRKQEMKKALKHGQLPLIEAREK